MDPIFAVLVIILVGVLCWVALTYIPMSEPFPRIMIAVAVIATVLWLLCGFDIFCLSNHVKPQVFEVPIVAFYFSLMLALQQWPVLIGPYMEWGQCASVREYLDRRGYETGACELMPTGQDATHLNVIDVP